MPGKLRARGRVRHEPGTMNKTEEAYAELLKARLYAGEILRFEFEPESLRLAKRTTFTPDFRVQFPDGTIEFHEVKVMTKSGRVLIEDDARVKIKVAAEMHPYKFVIAAKQPKCNGGGWDFEEIDP